MTTSLCLPPDRPQIAVAASLVKVGAGKNDEVRARAFRVCANFRRAFMATFTSKEAACINLPYQEDKREIPILLCLVRYVIATGANCREGFTTEGISVVVRGHGKEAVSRVSLVCKWFLCIETASYAVNCAFFLSGFAAFFLKLGG